MRKAKDVVPDKWLNPNYAIKVLYDDDVHSFIWGIYDNGDKCLGGRRKVDKNSVDDVDQGKYTTWYMVPEMITLAIVQHLRDEAIQSGDTKYLYNLNAVIAEINLR